MIRGYTCIDNPQIPIEDEEIFTNPQKMADFALEGRYLSLPPVPMISVCLGSIFKFGRTTEPIFEKLEDVSLNMDYDKAEFKAMIEALRILGPEKTVIDIRGPISVLDNMVGAIEVMKAMRKKKDVLHSLYKDLTDIYIEYMRIFLDRGVRAFSFTESLLDVDVLGPREVKNYVNDFLLSFLKEVEKLYTEYNFVIHLCPKSSLALVDLEMAEFEEIDLLEKTPYIDIILSQDNIIMGDRCINLAPKEFDKVNKIVLKEN